MITPTDSNLDPTVGKPPRPPRRIPVSLRLFLASLPLIGIGSVLWIGIPVYRQHLAIREIERRGGNVATGSGELEWLSEWWSYDYGFSPFDDVVEVVLGLERITDADLHVLRAFPRLEGLHLDDSQITDAGLTHVTRCTALRRLDLSGTRITEAGLEKLGAFNDLELLELPDLKLTERGLKDLCKLPALREVTLNCGAKSVNGEFADDLEDRAFDLYWPTISDFQQTTHQTLLGKTVALVYCYSARDRQQIDPEVTYDLAKHVAYQLNGKRIKVVDPDRVYAWLDRHDEWRGTAELGTSFRVDYIVEIGLMDYGLTDPNETNRHHGRAECVVIVRKMDEEKKNGRVIYTKPIISNFPTDSQLDYDAMDDKEFKKRYLGFLSDEIGQLFYPLKFYPAKVAPKK